MRHPIRILQAALLLALCALCLSACAAGEKAQELRAWAGAAGGDSSPAQVYRAEDAGLTDLNPADWTPAPIPEGAAVLGVLELRQEETRRLLDAGEPAMQTVCTLTLYEGNRAALQWEALSLSFELPAADAQRLAALLPEANP